MLPSTWAAASVTANGISLNYYHTNPGSPTSGSKPVLICAHGITDNGLCWLRLAQALEPQVDLILVDARGHGQSDAPEDGYAAADHAADLAGLVGALGLDKPNFLGHSMGAATLSALGATYPALAGKVILEDPPWWPKPSGAKAAEFAVARRASMDERRDRMAGYHQQTQAEIIADGQKMNPKWDAAEFGPWSMAKQQFNLNATGFKMPVHWTEEVPNYSCDTLLITGDVAEGALVSPDVAANVLALNGRVSCAHIGGAGHNIRRDQFEHYRDAVISFLLD